MSREKAHMEGRLDGMIFARDIVKKDGIEELEREIERRQAGGINVRLTEKEIKNMLDDMQKDMFEFVFDKCLILGVAILHDTFDFGLEEIKKYHEAMAEAQHYLETGEAEWEDFIQSIEEELQIKFEIRHYKKP